MALFIYTCKMLITIVSGTPNINRSGYRPNGGESLSYDTFMAREGTHGVKRNADKSIINQDLKTPTILQSDTKDID
jgi:hypothetical protein